MPSPALTFFCELPEPELCALLDRAEVVDQVVALGAAVSMAFLDRSPGRARAVRELVRRGVPVTAWLVLPRHLGYFATADNVEEVRACYQALRRWAIDEGIRLQGIGIDVEMDVAIMDLLAASPWRVLLPALRTAFGVRRVEQALRGYRELIAEIRADGYPVETYQLPPVIDGRAAGSSLLGRAFGMLDLRADREVLMLYSSALPVGEAWVRSYARHADAVGLGVTGGGTVVVPPMSWAALERDLRLGARAGKRLYLFSLEGCVQRGWLERLAGVDFEGPVRLRSPASLVLDLGRVLLRMAMRAEAALLRLWRGRPPALGAGDREP